MAVKTSKADKKIAYDKKLCQFLDQYTQVLIAAADNVGSNQLQNIRKGLRGESVVLMGKNTMMKRSVRLHAEKTGNNAYLNLIPLLVVIFPLSCVFIAARLVCFFHLVAFMMRLDGYVHLDYESDQFTSFGLEIEMRNE